MKTNKINLLNSKYLLVKNVYFDIELVHVKPLHFFYEFLKRIFNLDIVDCLDVKLAHFVSNFFDLLINCLVVVSATFNDFLEIIHVTFL